MGSVNFDNTNEYLIYITEIEYENMLNYITNMDDIFNIILSSYDSFKIQLESNNSHYTSGDFQINYNETYHNPIYAKNNYTVKPGVDGDSGLDINILNLSIED